MAVPVLTVSTRIQLKILTHLRNSLFRRILMLQMVGRKNMSILGDPSKAIKIPQSLYPRKHLNSYCSAKGGKFSILHKSSMSLVKNQWDKKLLSTYSSVKQGIGAYKCVQSDGQSWIVSIEPVAERKLDDGSEARMVALQAKK